MADFTYPSKDLQKPDTLLSYLGSHWGHAWDNTHQIRSLMSARGSAENQKVIGLTEAQLTVSRLTIPILHLDHWFEVVILESALNNVEIATLRYGEEVTPGNQAVYGVDPVTGIEYKYGVANNMYSMFPTASDIREVPFIYNRITEASLTLTHGVDYFIDELDNAIAFRDNPFDNPLVPIRDVYKDGVVSDREIRLWGFRVGRETNNVFNHAGYVIGLQNESTQEYLDYVNAIWDSSVEGTGGKHLEEAVAALTDTPVVRNAAEVVEHVQKDVRHLLIITDLEVYKYPLNATAIVSVGDDVQAGDQLVDTVKIFEFHAGNVPSEADLAALQLDKSFLIAGYTDGISFRNRLVDTVVDTSGIFTRFEFEVGGFAGDTAQFWDDFHDRGVETPPTLAQLLDTRVNKVGEPGASNLPAQINPLEFLAENVLRNNAYVVKITANKQGPNRIPLDKARQLANIVPPHTAMILVVELAVEEEFVTMEAPGTDDEPGFEEAPLLGPGLEPIEETISGPSLITESPHLKYVEGVCL